MLTGLPELSTHYAGMGLWCKVILQVQGANKFAMQIKDAKFTRVNEVLRYLEKRVLYAGIPFVNQPFILF